MIIKDFEIDGLLLIEPNIFNDERGYFFESYNLEKFNKAIGHKINFVQDNHSFSSKDTLRGIHYQLPPFAQGKLVRVIEGHVFDVAVDLRAGSSTFGEWVGVHLDGKSMNQFWVPEGFGHGFYVLSETAHFLYKTTNFYNRESEGSILWDDPDLSIQWPIGGASPLVSNKDDQSPYFKDAKYFD